MSSLTSAPTSIAGIKHRANVIERRDGIKRMAALERASRDAGYENYRHAQRMLPARSAAPDSGPARPTLTISASWFDRHKSVHGTEALTVTLSKPWQQIIRPGQLRNTTRLRHFEAQDEISIRSIGDFPTATGARGAVAVVARTLAFMEATGLRPSISYPRAFRPGPEQSGTHLPGGDHDGVWHNPATKNHFLLDEPYVDAAGEPPRAAERIDWCERYDLLAARPTWPGMHNPHDGTRLFLFGKSKNRDELQEIVAALNRLSRPIAEKPWPGESM